MSEEPNRKSYVRQFGERSRVDSGLRVLPDIVSCTTYGILCHAPHKMPRAIGPPCGRIRQGAGRLWQGQSVRNSAICQTCEHQRRPRTDRTCLRPGHAFACETRLASDDNDEHECAHAI